VVQIFFLDFPIYLRSVEIHSNTISKWCVVAVGGKKGTKEKYKLRFTTKAYKLSYNYINYTINLVGRSLAGGVASTIQSSKNKFLVL
jgi:hypothetical protein